MTARIGSYRVQLGPDFGFADLAGIAGYLADLGISHVYCSPILQAAAGSTHGYDVVDPTRISEELGGEAGWRAVTAAVAGHDLALLLDIVPNHMSVADRRNRWWWDVLVAGRSSPYAGFFDIDWEHPLVRNRVMAPLLDEPAADAVAAGRLRLALDEGVVLAYHEQRLPLSRETLADMLRGTAAAELADRRRDADSAALREQLEAELAALLATSGPRAELDEVVGRWNGDRAALLGLVTSQHYALTEWKEATVLMNYRRFFDITSLVGVRVEDQAVLDATHALIDSLLDGDIVDGVRIDHVDGLREPRRYLDRMRTRHSRSRLVVEKILAADERLRDDWPVDGTTGYEFAAQAGGLFVDREGWGSLRRSWAATTGHPDDFSVITRHAKLEVIASTLRPNIDALVRAVRTVSLERGLPALADDTGRLRSGIIEYLLGLDVYRTYLESERAEPSPEDRCRITAAVGRAMASGGDPEALALLEAVMLGPRRPGAEQDLVLRLQQTGTVMTAKGTEDTAYYRFPVLSAACEVGGFPERPAVDVEAFHAANQERQRRWPDSMLATSTHDTKRSEDVRARLYLLSELPSEWAVLTGRWRERYQGMWAEGVPGRTMEELLYQTVVGSWPIDAERLEEYMLKAASEAKQRTSWVDPDNVYRRALSALIQGLLADPTFTGEVEALVERLRRPGHITSLAMTLLRLTSPGVPDTYQGTELWQLSLVDPDNRRPVDYVHRRTLLSSLDGSGGPAAWADEESGLSKLFLIRTALGLRRRRPELFDRRGVYRPLWAAGERREHAIAYARGAEPGAVAVVPRLVIGLGGEWGDTSLALPSGRWVNLMDGAAYVGTVRLAELHAGFPVALLERAEVGSPRPELD